MKRNIFFIISICLGIILLCSCGSDAPSSGDVATTAAQTTAAPTEIETEPVQTTVAPTQAQIRYETQAVYLLVKTDTKFFDGNLPYGSELEYDEYGRVTIRWNLSCGERNGKYTTYEYDEQGNLLKETQHNEKDETLTTYHLYTYDEKGLLVTDSSYDNKGELSYETVYSYDDAGWLISEKVTRFYKDPDSVVEKVMEYNEDHTQGTRYSYQDGVKNSWYEEETYDADGKITKLNRRNEDGTWGSSRDYFYDDQGRVIREEYNTSSETQADYDVIYTYDENGLLIKDLVDYYYGDETTYTYELREILVPVTG